MKIVSFEEFMKLPAGTVFANGEKWVPGGWRIKEGPPMEKDYFALDLDWSQFENMGSHEMFYMLDDAHEHGTSLPMTWDCSGRDGSFAYDDVFCVLEREDIEGLISVLQATLEATR